jgi:hypothetical protein
MCGGRGGDYWCANNECGTQWATIIHHTKPTAQALGQGWRNEFMKTYIFFRDDGWYLLDLKSDDSARRNAECNPGTLRVEVAFTGETVWEKDTS